MEEEDDAGRIIEDKGVTYAASTVGPAKERMNTGKSRHGESPTMGHVHNDSDSTARRVSRSKSSRDRERSIPPSKKSVTLATRPAARHSRTAPSMDATSHHRHSRDEASYYGLDPATITAATTRPRSKTAAPRPMSYSGFSRPPVSNARYHNTMMAPPPFPPFQPPPLQTSFPPGPPLPPPSLPPQSWQSPHRFSPMGPPPLPAPITAQPMYADPVPGPRPQKLQQRFDLARPQTSIGHRLPPATDYSYADSYFPDETPLPDMRRLSISARPNSARPSAIQDSPFSRPSVPPPRPQLTGNYPHGDDLYDDLESVFPDTASFYDLPPDTYRPRTRRPSMGATSIDYDSKPYITETVHSSGGRRDSFYTARSVSSGSGLEDKLRLASSYQDEISGGVRLTAETLHEANRVGGPSSRSTRSSGSRDESDWRQSATTRTTRSSNEDDRTMKVRGPAFIRMGETEVQCQVGAEVDITPRTSSRRAVGSDKSSYVDPDDRRSRFERPALRSRAASQTGSYAPHPIAQYDYSYGAGGFDYARLPYSHSPSNAYPV